MASKKKTSTSKPAAKRLGGFSGRAAKHLMSRRERLEAEINASVGRKPKKKKKNK